MNLSARVLKNTKSFQNIPNTISMLRDNNFDKAASQMELLWAATQNLAAEVQYLKKIVIFMEEEFKLRQIK